jgi:hypothetical protein
LDIAKDANYLLPPRHIYLMDLYGEINRMLFSMINKPEKFCIQNTSSRK